MKSQMCKICGHPHRLGDPHVLKIHDSQIVRYGEHSPIADAMERETKARKPRAHRALVEAEAAQAALIERPLQHFLAQPALIELLPPEATVLFKRAHNKLAMRAKRSQT